MKKMHERPLGLIAFVQVMGWCAVAIAGAVLAIFCVGLVKDLAQGFAELPGDLWELIQLLCCTGTDACLIWLLLEFVLMCGRVRRETAFTAANVKALGRIVLAFAIGGVLLLAAGWPIMDLLLLGMRGVSSPVWGLLPTFVAWAAALLVRAIQVLMERAVEMQTESDLTV